MKSTKKNFVFKCFIALCTLLSAFIIYFLVNRPVKIVLEVIDQDVQNLEFSFNETGKNPKFTEILRRSKKDSSHVILVLLTKKLKAMKYTKYAELISAYKKCDEKLPCTVYKIQRDDFLKVAKKRKY